MGESKMKIAIEEARNSAKLNDGGPFGAAVIKDGEILGIAHNETLKRQDSMAHSVMVALKMAEDEVGSHDLSGCEVWTVHEPCPMCLGACVCCGVSHVYYGLPNKMLGRLGIDVGKFGERYNNGEFIKRFMTQDSIVDCLSVYSDYYESKKEKDE